MKSRREIPNSIFQIAEVIYQAHYIWHKWHKPSDIPLNHIMLSWTSGHFTLSYLTQCQVNLILHRTISKKASLFHALLRRLMLNSTIKHYNVLFKHRESSHLAFVWIIGMIAQKWKKIMIRGFTWLFFLEKGQHSVYNLSDMCFFFVFFFLVCPRSFPITMFHSSL